MNKISLKTEGTNTIVTKSLCLVLPLVPPVHCLTVLAFLLPSGGVAGTCGLPATTSPNHRDLPS